MNESEVSVVSESISAKVSTINKTELPLNSES